MQRQGCQGGAWPRDQSAVRYGDDFLEWHDPCVDPVMHETVGIVAKHPSDGKFMPGAARQIQQRNCIKMEARIVP
jgi:hypothetical protein